MVLGFLLIPGLVWGQPVSMVHRVGVVVYVGWFDGCRKPGPTFGAWCPFFRAYLIMIKFSSLPFL